VRKLEEKVLRAALNYGKWRERANRTRDMKDRIKFVNSETRLGMAAQALFEAEEGQRREPKRRGKD
jgi:hypothetical protein